MASIDILYLFIVLLIVVITGYFINIIIRSILRKHKKLCKIYGHTWVYKPSGNYERFCLECNTDEETQKPFYDTEKYLKDFQNNIKVERYAPLFLSLFFSAVSFWHVSTLINSNLAPFVGISVFIGVFMSSARWRSARYSWR